MLEIVSALVLGGIGALAGAAAKETDWGRNMDEKLEDAFREIKEIKDNLIDKD